MRLTAAGRLLLGTTTESTFLLDVNGTARVSGATTISGLITASSGISVNARFDLSNDGANGVIVMQNLSNTLNLRKYVKVLGDDGAYGNNNASAAFQIDGTNRGFLPPRLTTTQKNAISSPAAGLQVYDSTTNTPNYYNGTAWVSLGGGGTSIYTADGTLTSNRTVSSGGFSLVFNPQTAFVTTLSAAPNDSTTALVSQNTLSYASGFSSTNIGNVYGAVAGINLQTFAGSATFETANLATAVASVNRIDFSSSGSTITMTQPFSSGIRAMTGHQSQIQYQGTNSGTITHAAISQNLGFYRPSAATGILTITNAYSLLINSLSDYGAGFTFTNRWGIYQAGASDKNYFAGDVGIGSNTVNAVWKLGVSGNIALSGFLSFGSVSSASSNAYIDVSASEVSIYAGTGRKMSFWSNGIVRSTISSAGNFLIGTTVDAGFLLDVNGTARVSGYALFGSGNTGTPLATLADFRGGSDNDFIQVARVSTSSDRYFRIYANGYVDALSTKTDSPAYNFAGAANANTAGNRGLFTITNTFNPTSGNATYATFAINQTINQTGGASGITRGLYINPTITAAADWRAIEVTLGVSVLAPATTASATLRIPSGTAPTSPTNGDIWFDGTNLFMRIGGLTKTFTII